MTTFKKILVPLALDPSSRQVLELGRMLADACGASLHLLHVIGEPLTPQDTLERKRREGCTHLEAMLDPVDRDLRHATTSCQVGTPASAILRYATDNAIDLIVMGTHRHGPTFRMVTGSIAESVVGLAPCPVLTITTAEDTSCPLPSDLTKPSAKAS